MANIFDGLEKLDDSNLQFQIAMLSETTITNVAKEMGQKAKRNTIKAVNFISSLFNNKNFQEPEVISLQDKIIEMNKSMNGLSRTELNQLMRKIIVEKLNALKVNVTFNSSNDKISVAIIEQAAKAYKNDINSDLTPSQKADSIQRRYEEKMYAQISKAMRKQDVVEMEKTNTVIQKEVDNLSEKQREELKKALGVNELKGETISKILKNAAGTTALMTTLQVSGFGAYIALTTIIHAIFTTVLGITIPFAVYTSLTSTLAFITGPAGWIAFGGMEMFLINKSKDKLIYELLSQVVWLSVNEYGGRFTPKDEELPSWIPEYARDAAEKEEAKYRNILSENEYLKSKYQMLNKQVTKSEAAILNNNEKITELNENIIKNKMKVKNLNEAKKDLEFKLIDARHEYEFKLKEMQQSEDIKKYAELESNIKNIQREIEAKNREMEITNDLLSDASKEIDYKAKEIEELKDRLKNSENEINILSNQLENSNEKLNSNIESKRKELEKRWSTVFVKFKFESSVLRDVAKEFRDSDDLGNVERALMDLHASNDYAALSRGKMQSYDNLHHMSFSIKQQFPCRISYEILKDSSNKKKVRIAKIYKHNKKYGQ